MTTTDGHKYDRGHSGPSIIRLSILRRVVRNPEIGHSMRPTMTMLQNCLIDSDCIIRQKWVD